MPPRPDKRMITRTMLVMLLDRAQFGAPFGVSGVFESDMPGTCVLCGWPYGVGTSLQKMRLGNVELGYGHAVCESWWLLLQKLIDTKSDPKIIMRESVGRGRQVCAICGQSVVDEPTFLERLPLPLSMPGSQRWICRPCKDGKVEGGQ